MSEGGHCFHFRDFCIFSLRNWVTGQGWGQMAPSLPLLRPHSHSASPRVLPPPVQGGAQGWGPGPLWAASAHSASSGPSLSVSCSPLSPAPSPLLRPGAGGGGRATSCLWLTQPLERGLYPIACGSHDSQSCAI